MTENTGDEDYIECVETKEIPLTDNANQNIYFTRNLGVITVAAGCVLAGISAYLGADTLKSHEGKKQLNSILHSSFDYLSSALPAETEAALKQYETGNTVAGKKAFETIEQKLQNVRGNLEQQEIFAQSRGVDLHSTIISTAIAENVVKNTAQGYIASDVRRPHVLSTIHSVQQTAQYTQTPISEHQYKFEMGLSIIFTLIGAYVLWKGGREAVKAQREINRRKIVNE